MYLSSLNHQPEVCLDLLRHAYLTLTWLSKLTSHTSISPAN